MSAFQIGTLNIEGSSALAPMAGVADRAMREVCREFGAAFTVGELVSAKGICMNDKKSAELLRIGPAERPAAVQLFGSNPDEMAEAARRAMEFEPDFIDINMGCPAPKVISGGGGSALHRDPELAGRIVAAVVKAVPVPVTVKIRAGYTRAERNAPELARHCEAAGAAAVTVHGRTREQMYAPPVDLDIIRMVKEAVRIPVIGNGDIKSPEDALSMLRETGCDFLMVGRGAMGAPWIFSQIDAALSGREIPPAPPLPARMELMLRQVRRMVEYKGEYTALREARRHVAYYLRGLKGAALLRRDCGDICTFADVERIAARALEQNPEL